MILLELDQNEASVGCRKCLTPVCWVTHLKALPVRTEPCWKWTFHKPTPPFTAKSAPASGNFSPFNTKHVEQQRRMDIRCVFPWKMGWKRYPRQLSSSLRSSRIGDLHGERSELGIYTSRAPCPGARRGCSSVGFGVFPPSPEPLIQSRMLWNLLPHTALF